MLHAFGYFGFSSLSGVVSIRRHSVMIEFSTYRSSQCMDMGSVGGCSIVFIWIACVALSELISQRLM